MRKRIYEVIELSQDGDRLSSVYDYVMMTTITLSLIPLVFKETTPVLYVLDKLTVCIFIADYLLRLATADYKLGKPGVISFLRYPFTFMALVDLLSILPSLTLLNSGFKVLRVLRMTRAFRAFRVLRAMRYSKSLRIIADVLHNSRDSLLAVGTLAVGYIFISALVIFNAEPDSFGSFFEAMYWATVSLTTVGYGDIYPVTTIGRIVAMLSSVSGVAIVALPSGIITAGYMKELDARRKEEQRPKLEDLPAEVDEGEALHPLAYNPKAPRL
ncbi:MAG: ion transporter [Oscillospiraceae bacterium]|nr:ion transporter [Oscillospiraceae bacterium]